MKPSLKHSLQYNNKVKLVKLLDEEKFELKQEVMLLELVRCRQIEVPGGKPNQIVHPEHQRTTVGAEGLLARAAKGGTF